MLTAWIRVVICGSVVSLLLVATTFGQQSMSGAVLLDGPVSQPRTEFKYRKQWAVVVGIDYRRDDRGMAEGDVPRLQHAELDAKAVFELLVDKFGFQKTNATKLIGPEATQSKIREQIGALATDQQVTAEDCVLVYFSGHGVLQKVAADNSQRGYLLPIDVKWTDDQPNPGTAISLDDIVKMLKDSPAKHKLFILDCCHSGAVFRLENLATLGNFDHEQTGEDVFAALGFQAITASRDNQKASDGRNGHSPFTNALLESLKTIPLRNERAIGRRLFTANQLFESMKPYLSGEGYSSPQRGWLGADRGEFHFLPDLNAVFSEESSGKQDRNTLLALTPTTFGNWWAYEVPWFMPGLRLAILQQNTPSRSTVDELDRDNLLAAARRAERRAEEPGVGSDPVFKMRYEHLNLLLSHRESNRQRETMRQIVTEMKQPQNAALLKAEDIHYQAVLHQLLGEIDEAEQCYADALRRYGAPAGTTPNPLEALCRLDAGMLSTSRNDLPVAKERIKTALKLFEGKAPKPFQVYALCREADVYRREGKFGMSHARMEEAVNLLTRWDPLESTLLSASTMKSRAWAFMEGWDFKQAERDFNTAKRILEQESHRTRFEGKIDRLHVLHGLSMIERYQGRSATALAKYRQLTPEIAKELRDLENRRDDDLPNYTEIRALLSARLVNSLERQADCSLFGAKPDFAEAADDYRRAILECKHLPEDQRDTQLVDLLYRRAAALCLFVADLACRKGSQACGTREIELAQAIYAEAETLQAALKKSKTVTELPLRTRLVQSLAAACLQGLTEKQDATDSTAVSQHLTDLARDPNSCDRDELERLMFFHKVLIDYRDLFGLRPYESLKHVAQLLSYCRSASRLDLPDPDLLAYLRPFYDTAFAAQLEMLPGHAKELIEIAWEATRGTPYMKPGEIQPLLVTYVARGKCHLLLDAPGGVSQTFALEEYLSAEQIQAASADNGQQPHQPNQAGLATLPDEVRKTLREIQRRERQPFVLRWRDPVLRIGYLTQALPNSGVAGNSDGKDRVVTLKPSVELDLKPAEQLVFPFNLRGVLEPEQFRDDQDGLSFKGSPVQRTFDGPAANESMSSTAK